jgi:hypothetical protein
LFFRQMQDSCKNSIAEIVRIAPQQGSKEWEKGVAKNKHSERSYEVQKENGRFIRRNRKYLRKTKEQFNPYNAPEDTNRPFSFCTSYDLSLCLFFATPFSHSLLPCCGAIRTISAIEFLQESCISVAVCLL